MSEIKSFVNNDGYASVFPLFYVNPKTNSMLVTFFMYTGDCHLFFEHFSLQIHRGKASTQKCFEWTKKKRFLKSSFHGSCTFAVFDRLTEHKQL